jgi:anti-sigma factor RsiW
MLAASARADGEVTPRDALAMTTHMADCRACAATAVEIDSLVELLDSAPQIELGLDLEDQLLDSVLQRTAALPPPRRRRRSPRHLRLIGIPLAVGLLGPSLAKGLSLAWGRPLPTAWQMPMPRALLERGIEAVAAAARLALEGITRLILRAPDIPPPALIPEVGSLGWGLLLSVLLPSLALLAMMTHLFWRDVLIWLGIHQNSD